jgi:two-component sensor histidine kinase
VDHVDLAKYVRDLVTKLSAMFDEPGMPLTIACGQVGLGLATSLGLILTELLTNAFKYGKPSGEGAARGAVRVELVESGGQLTLVVADQGPGLPDGFDFATDGNLGWKLLRRLARQVGGTLGYAYDGGARFTLTCDAASSRRTPRPNPAG